MKLLYPEIDTWVYNMQKTDPSINMLPMSLSHPGMLKMSRVVFPPAQKAVTPVRRGLIYYFFVPLLEVKQTDLHVSLSNAFTLAEG